MHPPSSVSRDRPGAARSGSPMRRTALSARPTVSGTQPLIPSICRPRPGRACRRDGGGERGQELRAGVLQVPAGAGVIPVRRERGDLVGAPDPQRHRGQDLLELAVVTGGEQPEGAPLAWLQRGTPEPEQGPLRRELARADGLAGADVADRFFEVPSGTWVVMVTRYSMVGASWRSSGTTVRSGKRTFELFRTGSGVTVRI